MKKTNIVSTLLCICAFFTGSTLFHANAAPENSSVTVPPPVELQYTARAQYSGFNLKGSSLMRWETKDGQYHIQTEIKAGLLGKILTTSATGQVDTDGLAPVKYTEKRLNKAEETASFNRTGRIVAFPERNRSVPLKNNTQDKASIVWHLVIMARENPDKFKPGAQFTIPVTGRSDIAPWVFKVMENEAVDTGLGRFDTIRLLRVKDDKNQRNELWLAPSLEWYPVRLVISEKENFRVEQILQKVTPLSSRAESR